jgi:hypothetical protein
MTVEERSRRELQEALMETIGPEHTDTLFGYLPPTGWADVATTRDVEALRAELRGELAQLRGEVRGEISELRGEIGELRGEVRSEIGAVRSEVSGLRADMDTLAATLRGEMHRELRVQFYSLAALMAAVLAVAVALSSHGLIG